MPVSVTPVVVQIAYSAAHVANGQISNRPHANSRVSSLRVLAGRSLVQAGLSVLRMAEEPKHHRNSRDVEGDHD